MDAYNEILSLVNAKEVSDGIEFPKLYLNKWLVLGQTEYVCRYGTLSDGHEKLTPSQRYAQAIKEQYYIAISVRSERTLAKRAKADLWDAQELLKTAETPQDRLRAEAAIEDAETRLMTSLVNIEDKMRMLKTYAAVRAELGPMVEAQYPKGIEQAESDNWKAVAEYRLIKESVPGIARERLDNVPLSPVEKAKLGATYGRMDAVAPLMVTNKEHLKSIATDSKNPMLEFVNSVEKESA